MLLNEQDYNNNVKKIMDEKQSDITNYEKQLEEIKGKYSNQIHKLTEEKTSIMGNCEQLIHENEELIEKATTNEKQKQIYYDKYVQDCCALELELIITSIEKNQLKIADNTSNINISDSFNIPAIKHNIDMFKPPKIRMAAHSVDSKDNEATLYALLKQKKAVAIKINMWNMEFEQKQGRKPNKQEKDPIKNLYNQYKSLKDKIQEVDTVDTRKRTDLNISEASDSGFIKKFGSITISDHKHKSIDTEEAKLDSANLKYEINESKLQIKDTNIISMSHKLKCNIKNENTDHLRAKDNDEYATDNLLRIEYQKILQENEELRKTNAMLTHITSKADEQHIKPYVHVENCSENNNVYKIKAEKYDTLILEFQSVQTKALRDGPSAAIAELNIKLQKESYESQTVISQLKQQIKQMTKETEEIRSSSEYYKTQIRNFETLNSELSKLKIEYAKLTADNNYLNSVIAKLNPANNERSNSVFEENIYLKEQINELRLECANNDGISATAVSLKNDLLEAQKEIDILIKYKEEHTQCKNKINALLEQTNRLKEIISKPSSDTGYIGQLKLEISNAIKENECQRLNIQRLQIANEEIETCKCIATTQKQQIAELIREIQQLNFERDVLKVSNEQQIMKNAQINHMRLLLMSKEANKFPTDKSEMMKEINKIITENTQIMSKTEKVGKENKELSIQINKLQLTEQKYKETLLKIKEMELLLQNREKDETKAGNAQSESIIKEKSELIEKYKKEFEDSKLSIEQHNKNNKVLTESKEQEIIAMKKQFALLETNYKAKIESLQQKCDCDIKQKEEQIATLNSQLSNQTSQIKKLQQDKETLETAIDKNSKNYTLLEHEIDKYKKNADIILSLESQKQTADVEAKAFREKTVNLEKKYKEEVIKRKKFYNMLEDLKGKIRVCCRIRPLNDKEKDMDCTSVVTIPDEFTVNLETNTGSKQFSFDACYGPDATQENVFEDTKRLIQSSVDGYNVCLFAYGQTGSGKTYTIQGPDDNPGVAPRAFMELFEVIKLNSQVTYHLQCYMVELYKNHLRDLFYVNNGKEAPKLDIKEDIKKAMSVQNAVIKPFTSVQEVQNYFKFGLQNRQTAKTLMNDTSSRSHLIFVILISSENKQTSEKTYSKLTFVDLAGSERVAKSGANAERLKEGTAINQSLSKLGDVIAALSDDSKLIIRQSKAYTVQG